jgi:cytochrome c oxidase subunit 3
MKRNFTDELSPELREKTKKNLVYVGIFSIVMLFAGFTSAYIVSMGDSFWVKYPLPTGFWLSTAVIIASSIFFELALRFVRKNDLKMLKVFMFLTLVSALGFVYFQFKGYGQLISEGAHPANNRILVTEGNYGEYYTVKMNGSFIDIDGNAFLINGREMSRKELDAYKNFMSQFLKVDRRKDLIVKNYGSGFVLYLSNVPVGLINGKLCTPDGKELQYVDLLRLQQLSVNVKDERGDFFHRGKIGTDFDIYFKGEKLEYAQRQLRFKGQKLNRYLQIKAMETSDTASSYLFIITFLHLLHIAVALIYLLRVTIGSFTGKFSSSEFLSLKLGAIFWHFLGLLWLYLLLFLLFIH